MKLGGEFFKPDAPCEVVFMAKSGQRTFFARNQGEPVNQSEPVNKAEPVPEPDQYHAQITNLNYFFQKI